MAGSLGTSRDQGRRPTLSPVRLQKPDSDQPLQRKRAIYRRDSLARDSLDGTEFWFSRPNAGIFGLKSSEIGRDKLPGGERGIRTPDRAFDPITV